MEHENQTGESDEWYTPRWIFNAFNCTFDLDPFSPSHNHWTPAKEFYTKEDDGMTKDWEGKFVYVNPPFKGRNGHVPALEKFIENNNGIACVRAYTSAAWFHEYATKADCLLFPKGKTKFIRPDGTTGNSPGSGIVLVGMGEKALNVLRNCEIGWFVDNR